MPDQPQILRHTPPRHLKTYGVVALCAAAAIVGLGLVSRVRADQNLRRWADAQAVPAVKVIPISADAGASVLVLPGNIQSFSDAPIHARVSGYLKRWYADIGAPVKAGQTLAEIDTPDLDQQLAQAKADLATAVANQRLAQTTATRWQSLLAQDAASRQDADERNGDLAAKTALVAAARANVDRLQALESFKRISAPFDGVVTTRSTDIGALITVGSPTDVPLFTVSDEHKLRVYIHVPESYTADIKPGMSATLTVPEHPGQVFTAQLATTADAITPQNGTLLVQLQIDNATNALKPGSYAQVRFALPHDSAAGQIPASTLMFRDTGPSVALIGPDGRVVIRPVTIARDMGTTIEIASGLNASDRLIDNPPDSLRAGDKVRIAASGPQGAPHAGA